jgi:ABC-type transport system involved in multi-copper enzyme maturation permease subunit
MTALLITEVRRMTSRRLFRVIAALASLGIVIAVVIVAVRSGPANGVGGNSPFHLTALTVALKGVSPLLVIAAWFLGASFVGADWHAGTITTLLTWEPRRLRVIMAKLAGCLAVVFVMVIALQSLLGGGLALAAALRGTTIGVDGAWIRETVGVALRVAALSALGAAVGFAISSSARNTAAALGVGFGYLFVVENLVRGLRPGWVRWLMGDNAVVFINGQSAGLSFNRTMLQAGLLLSVYAAALVMIAVALFRGRDVT